jgi:hypothetical protein
MSIVVHRYDRFSAEATGRVCLAVELDDAEPVATSLVTTMLRLRFVWRLTLLRYAAATLAPPLDNR